MPKKKPTPEECAARLDALEAARAVKVAQADVFWDGGFYYFAAQGSSERSEGFETIHDACVATIAAGLKIAAVNMTRASHPGLK